VTWDELPAMAFNMIDQRVLPYPRGKEMTKDVLFTWFDDVFLGKVEPKTDDFAKEIKDPDLPKYLLNNTIIGTRANYRDLVFEEGYDAVMFLYTTEVISDM